jgi:hypothetical protein
VLGGLEFKMRTGIVYAIVLLVAAAANPYEFQPGQILRATGNVYIRDSPPRGLFYTMGSIVGVVSEGERVRLLEEEEVWAIFRTHNWLRVQRLGSDIPAKQRIGWVYAGIVGGQSYFERPEDGIGESER